MPDTPWISVPIDEFIQSACSNDNQITIVWRYPLPRDTLSRKCTVCSAAKWNELFMSKSFVPRYKDGGTPYDTNAQIFTLDEYCSQNGYSERDKAAALLNAAPTIQITTAYDNSLDRRLIVDGVKRAIGIQQKVDVEKSFPKVTILECYGPQVSKRFLDFSHIH
jgi:hypothetical protein